MKRMLAGLGLVAVLFVSGCQTWVPEAGITMPSPHYLRHPPTYIPPSPPFPLQKELDGMIDAAARTAPGGPVGMGLGGL